MNFDFSRGRITIVICPMDMRSGIDRLSRIASIQLGIDVSKGNDFVVFVSRSQAVCKMLWADDRGVCLLTRKLHTGRFERFLGRSGDVATKTFTYEDLMNFLDGKPIMMRRNSLYE